MSTPVPVQYSPRGCPLVELVYKIEEDQFYLMIHSGYSWRAMPLPVKLTGQISCFILPLAADLPGPIPAKLSSP